MTPDEMITCLESLIQDRFSFIQGEEDYDMIYREDIAALEAAVDAVRRRKPKKAVIHDYQNGLYYFCPHCYSSISRGGEITYCWHCGQAVEFEEESDHVRSEEDP